MTPAVPSTGLPASHVVLLLYCLLAAVTDVRRGLIPNPLTLSALVAGLLLHAWAAGWGGISQSLVGAGACALVPLLLFVGGAMGGGDLKLLTAIGALCGAVDGLEVQLLSYVIAGVYAGGALAYRGRLWVTLASALTRVLPSRLRPSWPQADEELGRELRMGVPIALAACAVVLPPAVLPW